MSLLSSHWARCPWIILAIFWVNACSTTDGNFSVGDATYLDTAEKNYLEGTKSKENKNYEQAVNYFEYVKNQFPYSKYAALADLAIADAYFESEQWLLAAESYQFFIQFHPKHEKVGWASFQIANSYTQAIPKNYPLMPKAHEKDQSTAESTVVAWDRFLRKFPKHEKVKEAKAQRKKARNLLTDYEWAVAEFYERKERYQGAAWRYETIFRKYPETDRAPKAMVKAAQLYQDELNEKDKAKAIIQELLKKHPKSDAAQAFKAEQSSF